MLFAVEYIKLCLLINSAAPWCQCKKLSRMVYRRPLTFFSILSKMDEYLIPSSGKIKLAITCKFDKLD